MSKIVVGLKANKVLKKLILASKKTKQYNTI